MSRVRVLPMLAALVASACDSPFLHEVVRRKGTNDTGCLAPSGTVDGLTVAVVDGVVTLSWTSAADDESGFTVERRSSLAPTWGELVRLAPDAAGYSDGQVALDTEYTYRVAAFRTAAGQTCPSPASPEVTLRTRPAAVASPAAASRAGVVDLGWVDVNEFEEGVRVERRTGEGDYVSLGAVAANATAYADATITAGQTYGYRLVAFNASGDAEAALVEVTAVRPPVLSWGDDPSFDPVCVLRVPGVATFDVENGAVYASAGGAVDVGSTAVVATATGVTAPLTGVAAGSLNVTWSVIDDTGGEATIARALNVSVETAVRGPARRPRPDLGEWTSEGVHALMPACGDCTGSPAALATGVDHTCAVTSAGEVECWGGDDTYACPDEDGSLFWCATGKLGHGGDDRVTTVAVACAGGATEADCGDAVTGLVQIDGGDSSTCGVTSDGEVRCWGYNSGGELGIGVGDESAFPKPVCLEGDGLGACVTRLTGVATVSVGYGHACAVLTSGAVYCWGANGDGQLGDGTTTASDVAKPACASGSDTTCVPLTGMRAVSAGEDHTCAIDTAGLAWCWGDNDYKALGHAGASDSPNPIAVCNGPTGCPQLDNVLEIEAASSFTCARIGATEGPAQVVCWGDNDCGSLGDGNGGDCSSISADSDVPVPVCLVDAEGAACLDPLDDATQLAAGMPSVCALRSNGQVVCWGANYSDDLGHDSADEATMFDYAVPVCSSGEGASCVPMTGVTHIAVGASVACALGAGNRVYCWGYAPLGALGYGGVVAVADPVPACRLGALGCTPVTDLTSLTAGSDHVCGLAGGKLSCWGYNYYYSLPVPTRYYAYNPRPVVLGPGAEVPPLDEVLSVSAGLSSTCALREDATVWCWGHDYAGQRGAGAIVNTAQSHASPVCASGSGPACPRLTGVTALSVGDAFACAVLFDGHVRCWGMNDCGQLGNGDSGVCDGSVASKSAIAKPVCTTGRDDTCVRLTGAVSVSAGNSHACAVRDDGSVWCWGWNFNGQLGDGTVNSQRWAGPVCTQGDGASCVPLGGAVAVYAAVDHTCALMENGQARCWGFNGCGELGTATAADCQSSVNQLHPVVVCSAPGAPCVPLSGIVSMGVGGSFTCALIQDGSVKCWGRDDAAQIGQGIGSDAVVVPSSVCAGNGTSRDCDGACAAPLGGAVALSVGLDYACVVTEAGELRCWGHNDVGQIGNGGLSGNYYCAAVETCGAVGDGEGCAGGEVFASASHMSCDVYSVEVP